MLGQTRLEPRKALGGAVIVRHPRADEADVPISRRDDRLRHRLARPPLRDADERIDRLAVAVHDLDHRAVGGTEHRARGV